MIPDFPSSAPPPNLAALHEPYAALLQAALAQSGPKQADLALDIGCGSGIKADWLAEHLAPAGRIIGIDLAHNALMAAQSRPLTPICADAHHLPLRSACVDLAWMLLTLGLLDQPAHALAEARRVLRPDGTFVLAVATQRWVRLRHWPAALTTAWSDRPLPAPADDLGAELIADLRQSGFQQVDVRAYLLEPPGLTPVAAALPLADWNSLRPYLREHLDPQLEAECIAAEDAAEPDPLPILLICTGHP